MAKKKGSVRKQYPVIHEEFGCRISVQSGAKVAGDNELVTCSICLKELNKIQKDRESYRGDI